MHVQAAAECPELQESVARLCVAWWQAGAPGKEALITQTIPYLLVRALSTCENLSSCYCLLSHTGVRHSMYVGFNIKVASKPPFEPPIRSQALECTVAVISRT